MATQLPPHPGHAPSTASDDPSTTPRRTSPVLLGALAVALVALGIGWYQQRDAGSAAMMDTTGSPVVLEDAANTPPPAASRTTGTAQDARQRAPSRALASDRAPRPLADNPVPSYPRDALRSGSEGRVVVSIAVGADGVPTDVSVTERSGDRSLDRAALQAARQWRFEPAVRDGKAVAATVRLPVDFNRG